MLECLVSENELKVFVPDKTDKFLDLQHCSFLHDTKRESLWTQSRPQLKFLQIESIGTFNKRLGSQRHKVRDKFPIQLRAFSPLRGGESILHSDEALLHQNDALRDEVAALEAIYGADIHVSSHTDDPSQLSSIGFGVMIGPSLRMRLLCPATYPRDPPTVVLDAAANASSPAAPPPAHLAQASASLRAHLAPLQEGMRGAPMILDLVASTQEWAADDAAAAAAAAAASGQRKIPCGPAVGDAGGRRRGLRRRGGGLGRGGGPARRESSARPSRPSPEAFAQLRARMQQELPPPLRSAPRR